MKITNPDILVVAKGDGWYGGSAGFDYGYGGGGGSGHIGMNIIDGKIVSGNTLFISPDGIPETGHIVNGYARITFIG